MRALPSGTVTLLFTDIEGSTRLLHELGQDRFDELLGEHRRALREAFAAHNGIELRTEGDSFFAAFRGANDAVAAAEQAQRSLSDVPIRVRIGIHTGEPLRVEHEDGYVGLDVHRAARIAAAANGGQVLLSQATAELLDDAIELRDLGQHRLKDLAQPERLYQLGGARFPALRSLSQSNLPPPPTPLIGRERELAELGELIRGDGVRLVTVTGPPGTGKTRLVLAHAALTQGDYPDGVFFAELSAVVDPALVASTIANVLGLEDAGGQPLAERAAKELASKRLLLVVDNFEHVLDAAPVLNELLAAAPDVKILTTSRARLQLAAEHEFPLLPLNEDEAVRLFAERAHAAQPGFGLNGNRQLVSEICRHLEGLPLALELAAARVKVLSLESLLARLERRLPLLTSGARDAPERQRTMQATIEWSYELLAPEEKELLGRLSVFAGGCTLEEAEEVCGADLDTLASLVDKSLLRHTARGRFRMLETIREYAAGRLEASGELDEIRDRHADYYLALAEEAKPRLAQRQDQVELLERFRTEHENLRAAIVRTLEVDPEDRAMRLGAGLCAYFGYRKLMEGRQWLEEILARGGSKRPAERAEVLSGAGNLAEGQGDFATAARLFEESHALRQQLGDEPAIAKSLYDLGWLALHQGDNERARVFLEESVEIRRKTGVDPALVGAVLNRLGIVALYEGNFERAEEIWQECLAIARQRGDQAGEGAAIGNLSLVAVYRGDYELGIARSEQGLTIDRRIGSVEGIIDGLDNMGRANVGLGEHARAREVFAEGLVLAEQADYKWGIAECLEGLAAVAAALEEDERAALLDAAAQSLREVVGAPLPAVDRPEHERRAALVRERLGEEPWASARARGAEMPMSDAVQLGLQPVEPKTAPSAL